jgi:hypothetical protein
MNLCVFAFLSSCTKVTSDNAPKVPDTSPLANKMPIKYDSQKGGFSYNLSENGKGTILTLEDSKSRYTYDEFSFIGELISYAETPKNQAIEDAIEKYFSEHPDAVDIMNGRIHYYCIDLINEVNIYCDKKFNDIEAGKSLNTFFTVQGEFISKINNKYVAFYWENILESDLLKKGQLIFPRDFSIKLKTSPEVEDVYTFTIEIKGDGISDRKATLAIGLK